MSSRRTTARTAAERANPRISAQRISHVIAKLMDSARPIWLRSSMADCPIITRFGRVEDT
jgi:hypothetical protein